MKYLMWDVDGTLVLTGGAGKDAMINVIKDYYFLDAFDFTQSLAGRTDSDIIKSVVTRLRGRCSSAEAAGLLKMFTSGEIAKRKQQKKQG